MHSVRVSTELAFGVTEFTILSWNMQNFLRIHMYSSSDNKNISNSACRVRNLKFATSKTLVNFMKKMMFLSKNWYFSVQKAIIYYTFNKSHHNSFILLVFSQVANFRYVANFRFLTLYILFQRDIVWPNNRKDPH